MGCRHLHLLHSWQSIIDSIDVSLHCPPGTVRPQLRLCSDTENRCGPFNLLYFIPTRHLVDLAAALGTSRVGCTSPSFDGLVSFMIVSKTESPGHHFIAGHFPNDSGWRWNDESWNDMISLGELSAARQKTGSLCLALVSVLAEPWNNEPSLFIRVYLVNHNTSEFSIQAQDNWPCVCPSSPASCHRASSKLRQLATMRLPH